MNQWITQLPMGVKKRYAVLILTFFLFSYILPLGALDLFEPDETRYGEISREMIAGGDWIVPHLNGLRYFEKPPLGYWVHAGSILLFGENNFTVRLPSALAAGLAALLIYALVGRIRHDKTEEDGFAAIFAALLFLSCFGVFVVGNAAVLDNLLSLFLTSSIATFYLASEAPPESAGEKRLLLLSGALCGLAFLTKGFLAFAVPVLVLVSYLVWQRRYSDLLRMSWLPILAGVLVALPWGILIHLREPDFWHYFFWNEHIRRFMNENAQHSQPFWFYLKEAPVMFMPWTLMVPAAVPGIREQSNEQGPQGRLMRLSICWLVLPYMFFSLTTGKLPTYILPCFPPFAILMTLALLHALKKEGRQKLIQWGILGNRIIFGLILLAFLYVQFFDHDAIPPYSQPWKAVLAAGGIFSIILLGFWAFRSKRWKDKILLFGLAPLPLFFIAHFVIPASAIESKSPGPLLELHRGDVGKDVVVISDSNTFRAVNWYLQRNDIYLMGGHGELKYGFSYKDSSHRLLDVNSTIDLINSNPGKTVLIAKVEMISKLRDQLPKPVSQDEGGPSGYVFWKY